MSLEYIMKINPIFPYYLQRNETYVVEDCSKILICTATGKLRERKLKKCPRNSFKKRINGKCRCVCLNGYLKKKERCIPGNLVSISYFIILDNR